MRIPKHIGIIPDGNRRWAKQAGLEKKDGYAHGLTPGLELLRLAKQAGVQEITYYGFTTDNCGRPPEQVRAFSQACVDAVELITSEAVSLLVIGDPETPLHFPGRCCRTPPNGFQRRRHPRQLSCELRVGVGPGPIESAPAHAGTRSAASSAPTMSPGWSW